MTVERQSPCKVNLLLNILGKRADGFHELETVIYPLALCDGLTFDRGGTGIQLTCSDPALPTDSANLVHRAVAQFLQAAGIEEGVRIHLAKRVPLSAGLGGGSGNAAATLLGLNELFGGPLPPDRLRLLASLLGSDVPFFLQPKPALATGRGEHIEPLDCLPALRDAVFLLIHPGFGIATGWAYQQVERFPSALNGQPGRARRLIEALETADLSRASAEFYNALEAPALEKFPILGLYQEFLRAQGARAAMMSGSGSTTFAIAASEPAAQALEEKFKARFGPCWTAVVPVAEG